MFTLIITVYVAIFVPERDPELEKLIPADKVNTEDEVTISMTFSILKDVLFNKNV
jgi:autotransporter translocation and assembly factor TamB